MFYQYFFKDIVKEFVAKLSENPFFFEAKVRRVEVTYIEVNDLHTHGIFQARKRRIYIKYIINLSDPDEYIMYVMAHEIAHCLFWNGNLPFLDYCKTDKSYAISTLQRKTDYEDYGLALEEFLADYMAISVVCSLNPHLSAEELIDIVATTNPNSRLAKGSFELSKKILSLFSIDGALELDAPFDQIIKYGRNMVSPKNLLLYEACYGDLSTVITKYDSAMKKKGSWKEMNLLLESFLCSRNNFERKEVLESLNDYLELSY